MTDEAEVAKAAPEQSSAPESTTEETVKPVEAEAGQNAEDHAKASSEGADDKDADPASAETDNDEGDEEKPKRKTRTSQLRAKIREKDTEIEDLRRRLAERESDDRLKPPSEADFNGDFEAFNRAQIAFETAKLLKQEKADETREAIETRQKEIRKARLEDHLDRVEIAREAIPDYDAVIESGLNMNARPENLDLLMASEKSELIAYHLARSPKEAREFAHMPPTEAARTIGRLEVSLSLPKPKTKTEAPAPVSPLKGTASPTPDPSKMSMDEYVAWRKKEERKAS